MLVLTRKVNESIVVPSQRLQIVVVDICGDKVRIGVKAPQDVAIWRDEIWQQIAFDVFNQEEEGGQ